MLSLTANHPDRSNALKQAFADVAAPLLSDQEPGEDAVGLLLLVITDAALSGDRTILAAAEEAVVRLDSYVDQDAPWASELHGRLWSVRHLAGLSRFLLDEEERLAAQVLT